MRILHLYKSYYPESHGGVEALIKTLISLDKKNESEVVYFYPKGKFTNTIFGHKAYRFNPTIYFASTPISLAALFKFKKFVNGYDIIHYHCPYPFADLLHFIWRPKVPYIITYHMDIVKQKKLLFFYQPLYKWFLKGAKKITITSSRMLETSTLLKNYQDKCQVIPIGIADYNKINSKKIEKIIDQYGQFVVFVGVFRYYKGLQYLIAACKSIKINLLLIGSGGEEVKLKAQANGAKNIYFLSGINDDEKYHYMKAAMAVVLPSHLRTEAFGIVLVEGLMLGRPLISCEIGTGTSFINQDGKTGLVVKPADASELKNAILKIAADKKLENKFAKNARLRYESQFSVAKMLKSYQNIYQEIDHDFLPRKN